MVKGALVGDGPDGRAVGEGACFIVAEATGEEELVRASRVWEILIVLVMFFPGL